LDSSFTVKPRDNVARTVVGRSNIVRTDLAPSQSVNAAQQASVSHHSPDTLMRDPSLDPQCQSVLDREREEREREERERRRARKDEIMQRQKAYGRSMEQPDVPHDDDTPHADFQV
jgi:hypothetical protein